MFSSAVAMSKVLSKKIFLEHNLPTPKFKVIRTLKDLKEAPDILGFPIVLKPNSEGSSLGMSKISKLNEMEDAYKAAIEFDDILLAEEFIQGKEITVTILKNKTLPTIRVKTNRNFYDYFAKYKSNKTEYICPGTSNISEEEIYANIALEAFDALHCSGWGRVDFMCEKNNSPKILEINTVPGMTKKSLVPMSAICEGIDFETLCWTILETSF
jgi:D-alanine-D-alanine ligase